MHAIFRLFDNDQVFMTQLINNFNSYNFANWERNLSFGQEFEHGYRALRAGILKTEPPRRIPGQSRMFSSFHSPCTSGPALVPSVDGTQTHSWYYFLNVNTHISKFIRNFFFFKTVSLKTKFSLLVIILFALCHTTAMAEEENHPVLTDISLIDKYAAF